MILYMCIIVDLILFYGIYEMLQYLKMKKSNGYKLMGRKLEYMQIPGRPTRYKIVVEFAFNGVNKQKIVPVICGAKENLYTKGEIERIQNV